MYTVNLPQTVVVCHYNGYHLITSNAVDSQLCFLLFNVIIISSDWEVIHMRWNRNNPSSVHHWAHFHSPHGYLVMLIALSGLSQILKMSLCLRIIPADKPCLSLQHRQPLSSAICTITINTERRHIPNIYCIYFFTIILSPHLAHFAGYMSKKNTVVLYKGRPCLCKGGRGFELSLPLVWQTESNPKHTPSVEPMLLCQVARDALTDTVYIQMTDLWLSCHINLQVCLHQIEQITFRRN